MVAWDKEVVEVQDIKLGLFSISLKCKITEDSFE